MLVHRHNRALESLIIGHKVHGSLSTRQLRAQIRYQLFRIVRRNATRESSTNAGNPINQSCRNNRHIVLRLNERTIVIQVRQHGIIRLGKDLASNRIQLGEDVPLARRIIPAVEARAELAVGLKDIDIVRSHVILRHVDDRPIQRRLAVMIRTVFRNVPGELRDLDLARQLALECGKQYLSLRCLETIHAIGNRPSTIVDTEMPHLIMEELREIHVFPTGIQIRVLVVCFQPGLAIMCSLLVEYHIHHIITCCAGMDEIHNLHVGEVSFEFRGCGRSQSLKILDGPRRDGRTYRMAPRLVLAFIIEYHGYLTLLRSQNRRIHE